MEHLIIIALIVVLILLVVCRKSEHFDTYWNHSIGAQDIYSKSTDPVELDAAKHILTSERQANYTWSQREPNGMQLYDYYYDAALLDNQLDIKEDPTYAARDIESDYLDSKFQTLNTAPGLDLGASNYSKFELAGMLDMNPLYTVYNGEYITLSQKSY
jgi:hypothetical protein